MSMPKLLGSVIVFGALSVVLIAPVLVALLGR